MTLAKDIQQIRRYRKERHYVRSYKLNASLNTEDRAMCFKIYQQAPFWMREGGINVTEETFPLNFSSFNLH